MEKSRKLFKALTNIDAAYIEDANHFSFTVKQSLNVARLLLYAACFIMMILLAANIWAA